MSKVVKRQTTSPEGLIMWETVGPVTITLERPAHSDQSGPGYPWYFRVACACGWSATLRASDSLGQLSFMHLARCPTFNTDWRPVGAGSN